MKHQLSSLLCCFESVTGRQVRAQPGRPEAAALGA